MRELFLGKPSHWALWVIICVVLYAAGDVHMHVRWFSWFLGLILLLSTASVLYIVLTYRPGDRITRDPFDEP
ncbi:MAG TPA: hypothetical protein VKB51_09425 [bacterium]|nr:hypothetical protein [bacterium]